MARVKIMKEELAENDLPMLCMICGTQKPTAQIPHVARYIGFPANLFGIFGKYVLAFKKWPMTVLVCDGCKSNFLAERVFSDIWKLVQFVALCYVGYLVVQEPQGIPQNLYIPAGMLLGVFILETLHFWTLGRKSAIRVTNIERHFVSFDFPNGHWGVAYTSHRRDMDADNKHKRPTPNLAPPASPFDSPAPATDSPFDAPLPPPGGVQIGDVAPPAEAPPPGAPVTSYTSGSGGGPVVTHAAEDLTMVAFEGSELAVIPEELPDLFKAVKLADSDLVQKALREGADVNEVLPNGMNPLHISVLVGDMQVTDMLIRLGLSPNGEMAGGLTPMHLAVQSNKPNLIGMMLAKKGDPNHRNAQGRTPLHWCAAVKDDRLDPKARLQIAQILRRGGGDVSIQDQTGKTPVDLARETGDTMLVTGLS